MLSDVLAATNQIKRMVTVLVLWGVVAACGGGAAGSGDPNATTRTSHSAIATATPEAGRDGDVGGPVGRDSESHQIFSGNPHHQHRGLE